MPYGEKEGWESEALSEDAQTAWFKAAYERRERSEADLESMRKLAILSLAGGALVGILGQAHGLLTEWRMPKLEPPGYILVHENTGAIDAPVVATDAPRLFNDMVRKRALSEFIKTCESYIPETWAKWDFRACMLFLTPDEQKRRVDDIGSNGPRYPVTVLGQRGWATPSQFNGFVKLGETGRDPDKIWHYQVRYERYESVNGVASRPHYTADVTFGFHPEMLIDPQDALINPSALQVSAFSTTKD